MYIMQVKTPQESTSVGILMVAVVVGLGVIKHAMGDSAIDSRQMTELPIFVLHRSCKI
jgi:hypothetical protein